jgi:Putative metal-binding motif
MERVRALDRRSSWLLIASVVALAACSSDSKSASETDLGSADAGDQDTATDVLPDGSGADSGASDSGTPDGGDTGGGSDGSGAADTTATLPNGAPCDTDDACISGLCVGVPGVAGQSVCAVVCLTDADCGEGLDCVPVTTGSDALSACLPVDSCLDGDGDGFGLGAACLGTDCDDSVVTVNPRGEELCDGVDNDCDGQLDDSAVDAGRACETGFAGGCSTGVTVCEANALICQPSQLPSPEVCDGIDNDCDGAADEDESGEPLSRRPSGNGGSGSLRFGSAVLFGRRLRRLPWTGAAQRRDLR